MQAERIRWPKEPYTFFNDGLLRITGYSREEMLGLNNRKIVDDYNNKKVFGTFHQVYLTGVPAHAFDWECIRRDGSRRYVEVSVSLRRDIYGRPVGFMGIARDITERKKYQTELEAKENELRQKNKSLEEANTALNVLMKPQQPSTQTGSDQSQNRAENSPAVAALTLTIGLTILPDFRKETATGCAGASSVRSTLAFSHHA